MRSLIPLFLTLLISTLAGQRITAQESQTLSIYFESGQATLDDAAQTLLDSFITMSQTWQNFDLDIRAYTDDVGNMDKNILLSNDRAESVRTYLDNANVVATTVAMAGAGEIALDPNMDVATQRKNNRRVDIHFTPFAPKDFDEFYSYFSNRNKQTYTINPSEETTILGDKGTMVTIPANGLCLADGTPISDQEVVIELREAYSYQDIFLENLTTTSHGDLIETDGMFYIGATTTDGQEVRLQEGQDMEVLMPSNRENMNGMELFYGDRSVNESSRAINWTAPRVPVKRTLSSFNLINNFCTDVALDSLVKSDIDTIALPELITQQPTKPTAPKRPQLKSTKPTMEITAQRYKRRKKEKEKDYQERLVTLYQRDSSVYALNYSNYLRNMEKYRTDSTKYEADVVKYQEAVAAYEQNHAEFLEWIRTEEEYLIGWLEMFDVRDPNQNNCLNRMGYQLWALEWYSRYIVKYADCYDIAKDSVLALWDKETQEAMDSAMLRSNQINYYTSARTDIVRRQGNGMDYGSASALWYFWGRSEKVYNGGHLSEVYATIDSAFVLYDALKTLNREAYNLNQRIAKYNGLITRGEGFGHYLEVILEYHQGLEALIEPLIAIERRNQELGRKYMNAVNINKFGWVNCDRFLNLPPAQKEHLIVLGNEADTNKVEGVVKYTAFCQDTKVVTELVPRVDGSFCTTYSGLPKNETVTLVGLKIEDGKVSMFKTEGKVSELTGLENPEFKEASLEEMRNVLAT